MTLDVHRPGPEKTQSEHCQERQHSYKEGSALEVVSALRLSLGSLVAVSLAPEASVPLAPASR